MKPATDVRRTNWWYVLPPAAGPILVVGDADQGEAFEQCMVVPAEPGPVADALAAGPFAGVAVPDLDALVVPAGRTDPLADLAAAVEPSGWLYAGFSNRPWRDPGLTIGRVRAILRAAGLDRLGIYLAAPDHVAPAYLIPAARRAEVDYFLRTLFFPYSAATGTRGAAKRSALRFLRIGAWVSPPWLRTAAWPWVAVVARRRPS